MRNEKQNEIPFDRASVRILLSKDKTIMLFSFVGGEGRFRNTTPTKPREDRFGYQTIGGIVSKETVCCVGGKVKH